MYIGVRPGVLLDEDNPINWDSPLNRGLVGEWAIQPASSYYGGPQLRDITFTKNTHRDGTINGAVTWDGLTHGRVRGALKGFAGGATTTTYVDLGNSSSLNPTAGIFVSAWIQSNATTVQWVVARDDNTLGRSFSFGISNGNTGKIYLQINGAGTLTTTEAPATVNKWIWIAFTGDATNGYFVYFADASTQFAQSVTTAAWVAPNSTTGATCIGRRTFATSQNGMKGMIGRVAIYNRCILASEAKNVWHEQMLNNPHRWNWLKPVTYFGIQGAAAAAGGGSPFTGPFGKLFKGAL